MSKSETLPACLQAAVAEVAAARGDSYNETLSSLVYCGLVSQGSDWDAAICKMDLVRLSEQLDVELGVTA